MGTSGNSLFPFLLLNVALQNRVVAMEKVTPHYREFLEREYQARLRRNPGYSLRAFARDLGMQVSKLSEALRGIRGISRTTAVKIAKRMRLSPQESEVFLSLIDFHQTRNQSARLKAEEKLESLRTSHQYDEMSLERFKIISDWHHFAILELTELSFFESDPKWIAGRLGISSKVAEASIERLLDFGLLERMKDGKLIQTQTNLATPSGTPSRALREHHSQLLMKADQALEKVDISERDFSAITLAADASQIEEVRAKIRKFRRSLGKELQESPGKNRVYCLSIQFFPLDQEKRSKGEMHEN